ncbi:carbohydrate sulfotransferase 11 isoform X2 [Hemibagrus wyckioides]|uniref:carbohydrate sulfotransferase 11 isoform X2 n=1 Tax=Hemibagrus wyckioides TaxID=337641 RepID=UPI00266C7B40|nr:carbohydrate sulfotransferase 11 isoform X2 [Hemibagrus wyckioides]
MMRMMKARIAMMKNMVMMVKPRVGRVLLATCAGSFFILILYFQNSARAEHLLGRTGFSGKLRRAPLQTLFDGDQNRSAVGMTLQGRRSFLDKACRSHTRKRRVLSPEDLRHLLVDDRHGLLYCYVPKVACTNWKRTLMVLTGDGRNRDPLAIPANEAHAPGRLRSLSEYSTAEINRRLRTYLKFIFVRDPFERLVSAYRNKFTRSYNTAFHKRYGTKIVQRHRANPRPEALEKGSDVSFEEFVYYLVDPRTQREEPFNEHWERVHALCHPCLIRYDVVGKYESLAQDSRYVLKLAGAEGEVEFPASSKSTRTTESMAAKFFNNISPFYQKKLYNLYRMDFLLFNYSTPTYLKFR